MIHPNYRPVGGYGLHVKAVHGTKLDRLGSGRSGHAANPRIERHQVLDRG